jgi:dihydroorotate dehydrogenase
VSQGGSRAYRAIRAIAFRLDAERAHDAGIALAARAGPALARTSPPGRDPRLAQRLWGLDFPNPIGLAAGYDKNARALATWRALGFGFVELGSVTPRAQTGNPRPRLFRLPEDDALVNRMGFNNDGADAIAERIARVRRSGPLGIPVGVNVGKQRETAPQDAARDYHDVIARTWGVADYLVLNVSSPNTPGLRDLQESGALSEVLSAAEDANRAEAARAGRAPHPLLVKIAPDLTDEQALSVAELARSRSLAGLIVSNTTLARPDLRSPRAAEAGGLSGRPLAARSLAMLRLVCAHAPELPVVSAGGVFDADDAWERLAAGARLVQVWTALAYEGPGLVRRMTRGLTERMDREGVAEIAALIGRGR